MIKFQHKLSEYRFLIMFDLASKITGVCIWDIPKNNIYKYDYIKVAGGADLPATALYKKLQELISGLCNETGISSKQILVYQEAMPTQIHGGASTVQTFLALSNSHTVLNLFCDLNNIAIYDYNGVYPITTHSYYKKLNNISGSNISVSKDDIKRYVCQKYGILESEITYDESDAIFLAQTFIEVKWNKDIDSEIKEVKKHKKTLKAAHAILKQDEYIEFLKELKVEVVSNGEINCI